MSFACFMFEADIYDWFCFYQNTAENIKCFKIGSTFYEKKLKPQKPQNLTYNSIESNIVGLQFV